MDAAEEVLVPVGVPVPAAAPVPVVEAVEVARAVLPVALVVEAVVRPQTEAAHLAEALGYPHPTVAADIMQVVLEHPMRPVPDHHLALRPSSCQSQRWPFSLAYGSLGHTPTLIPTHTIITTTTIATSRCP